MVNKVVVSTDCVCDLPQELVDKYSIPIMYYYMQVGEARFQDINEINSDSVLEYLLRGDSINARMNQIEDRIDRRLVVYDKRIESLESKVDFFVQT